MENPELNKKKRKKNVPADSQEQTTKQKKLGDGSKKKKKVTKKKSVDQENKNVPAESQEQTTTQKKLSDGSKKKKKNTKKKSVDPENKKKVKKAKQDVPVEETETETPEEPEEKADEEPVTFASLGLVDSLCDACAAIGWKTPTPIQREVLPYALKGDDVIGLAETGSGKTAAFGLPILQNLLNNPQGLHSLILAPTRELAFQIAEQIEALGAGINARCVVIVGGVDMIDQAIALAKKPHVVVATPGRIVDHFENTKGFNMRNLKFLVMDEADRLLNMDFEKEINKILLEVPQERNTYLFSATMTSKVAKLQRASLSNPVKVEVSHKYQTVKGLIQTYMFFPAKHKDCYLAYVLNELAGQTMIIFTSTCERTQKLTLLLRNLGFSATPIHGKMGQPKRLSSLNKFKTGDRSILIATDVVSRGLDIPSVDVVINFDIPTNSKDYIHRVGRTARAGRSGKSITLVTQYDVELFQRIEHLIGKKMEQYAIEEQNVMVLMERVSEAQRIATMTMREEADSKNNGKKGKGGGSFKKRK